MRAALAACAATVLASCPRASAPSTSGCMPIAATPPSAAEGSATSVDLDVLTYNVEGLPWPARTARAHRLAKIRTELLQLRRKGTAPDVVMLQEAFTPEAVRIATHSGYPHVARGPFATDKPEAPGTPLSTALRSERKLLKGEGFPKLLSSGLYIASIHPFAAVRAEPFRKSECAGYDCLANKGMLHVQLLVPGAPRPLDLFNTHLNSRGSAGVPFERSRVAHTVQVKRFNNFVASRRDPLNPLIVGGDFNMRRSPRRFSAFELSRSYRLVHGYCQPRREECGVRMSWDGDAPWMDTQDLQGFEDGASVSVRPVLVDAMFDQPWRGKPLADHDGLLVRYRISWPADPAPAARVRRPAEPPPLSNHPAVVCPTSESHT